MWHKVSPLAFRVPYIKNWLSSWYSDKKSYAIDLVKDVKIRDILNNELSWIPLWELIITRWDDVFNISIYTSKSSLVLWKDWENIDRIKVIIEKELWIKSVISVKEIKKPELNSSIVWYMIANQIEKRMPYKRAVKTAISKAMEKWAKWIKVKVGWRLNGAEIARKETFKDGNIPSQTIRSNIDYTSVRAETIYGTIGIKVWIYKWDIFK